MPLWEADGIYCYDVIFGCTCKWGEPVQPQMAIVKEDMNDEQPVDLGYKYLIFRETHVTHVTTYGWYPQPSITMEHEPLYR